MDAKQHDDAPFDLPAPRDLADRCMARAWDDDCDDASRLLLEQAALTNTALCGRCLELAGDIEVPDLRCDGQDDEHGGDDADL